MRSFSSSSRGQLHRRGRLGVPPRHRQHESRVASTICRVHVEARSGCCSAMTVSMWPRAAASMSLRATFLIFALAVFSKATPTEKGSRVGVSLPLRKGGCRPASTMVPLSRRYGQGAPGLRGCAVTRYDHTEGALRAPQRVSRLIVASKRRHHECRVASSTCRIHVEAGSS